MAKKKPKKPKALAQPKKSDTAQRVPTKPKVSGPVATSSVKVPGDRGEVMLYDAWKAGLPDLVETPSEMLLAQFQWWFVHFPSRRWAAVKGDRLEGLRQLKKFERGEDGVGLLPQMPPARAQPRAGGREAVGKKEAAADGEAAPPPPVKPKRVKFTAVPAEMDFDKAMKHVFPNARITREIERLLGAEDDVYDREGNAIGSKPAWMVRKEAVKLMIEHAQGRAGEKPPPPPDKKKVSYEELEKMILGSHATRMVLKSLIEKAEAKSSELPESGPAKAGTTNTEPERAGVPAVPSPEGKE